MVVATAAPTSPVSRKRPNPENKHRDQQDIDPVGDPQRPHGGGSIAGAAKYAVEHPQQQNRKVGREHPAGKGSALLRYLGVIGHQQENILRENIARHGNQNRQDQGDYDRLCPRPGRSILATFADAPGHHGRSRRAQADRQGIHQGQHRFGQAYRGHRFHTDLRHEKSIDHGKQRFHGHLENHRDGQQYNGAVDVACRKILLLPVDRLPQHPAQAMQPGFGHHRLIQYRLVRIVQWVRIMAFKTRIATRKFRGYFSNYPDACLFCIFSKN